jgi:sugar phosphate isomerase/epimerase
MLPERVPIGLNTYCLRALRWHDLPLLEYAAGLKLDAVFLQDSIDPGSNDPAHWKEVKDAAARLGLHLETGTGAALPRSAEHFDDSVKLLRDAIRRSAGMGSPIVRTLIVGDRAHFPPGPIERHMDTMVRVLRAVRGDALAAGVKFAIENHKELLCWETRQVIESAGTEFVGSYLDTGNPSFVMEDPLEAVETLGPVAVTFHLRDSILYEAPGGIAVQWAPLGEGVVDFKAIVARARQVMAPDVHIYIKPITGRPPEILPVYDAAFWNTFPEKKAASLARFLALAKRGHPYEKHVVIEDLQDRPTPPEFLAAVQFQQREHMERSVQYAGKVLDLGVKWRG